MYIFNREKMCYVDLLRTLSLSSYIFQYTRHNNNLRPFHLCKKIIQLIHNCLFFSIFLQTSNREKKHECTLRLKVYIVTKSVFLHQESKGEMLRGGTVSRVEVCGTRFLRCSGEI